MKRMSVGTRHRQHRQGPTTSGQQSSLYVNVQPPPPPPPPHSPVSAWSRKPEGRSPFLPMKTYHAGCIFKTHQSVPWRGREKRRPADFIVSGDIDPESYKKSPRSTDHAWVTVLWRPSTPEIDRATWPFLKYARASWPLVTATVAQKI